MERTQLARLVLQAAETSRLMGVDFVPAYGGAAALAPAPAPAPSPSLPARPVAVAEVKPARAAPALLPAFEITPSSRTPGDVQAALDALRQRYESDAPHKHFVTAHTKIVFGEGDPCARLMFVG